MMDKKIKAYNDNRLVSEGLLSAFLKDNEDSDEYIQDELKKFYTQDTVEFECFHSGNWRIETV
ncbi:hypothetical protein [Tissierella sp.]|uniref:hypothetical protein n=1 Tax=Tissierella sp. TaxID=41274 RepID=UPI0028555BDC|nr:hypothetical protein [Tissierella sp.]MDR7856115.1 hypothetical protein [Tissierella sp.]